MGITASTIPLGVLTLFLLHRAKGYLFPVVMFVSIFQAASIVNLSHSAGISLSYLILAFAIAKAYLRPAPKGIPFTPQVKMQCVLAAAFLAYSTLSAFVAPFIFEGVLVSNPKTGSNRPLAWETGHLNQLAYLILCTVLFFCVVRRVSAREIQMSLDWFLGGSVLASVIGLYQLGSLRLGLPFPSELFHSNPTYGIFEAYDIGGFARINGTFTEASAAAGFYTTALALVVWKLLHNELNRKNLVIAGFTATGLFLTISTTGYLCSAYIIAVSIIVYMQRWRGNASMRIARILLGSAVLASATALIVVPGTRESMFQLIDSVVLQKKETASYLERTQWNVEALATGAATDWLGAGYGVCRASSFVPTMIGNVGLPGFVIFLFLVLRTYRPILKRGILPVPIGAVLFALSVMFLDATIAGPEIGFPPLWLFLGAACQMSAWRSRTLPPQSGQIRVANQNLRRLTVVPSAT